MSATKLTPRALLLKAADVIEERGWCKQFLTIAGRVCANGAINVVEHGRPDYPLSSLFHGQRDKATQGAFRALGLSDDNPEEELADWNNSLPGRTGKRTVIARFRQAAESLKRKPKPKARKAGRK